MYCKSRVISYKSPLYNRHPYLVTKFVLIQLFVINFDKWQEIKLKEIGCMHEEQLDFKTMKRTEHSEHWF